MFVAIQIYSVNIDPNITGPLTNMAIYKATLFQSFFLTLLLSVTSLAYTAFRGDAISTDLDIDGLVKVLTSDEEAAKNILVTLGYVS